jgi:hypothetical protein
VKSPQRGLRFTRGSLKAKNDVFIAPGCILRDEYKGRRKNSFQGSVETSPEYEIFEGMKTQGKPVPTGDATKNPGTIWDRVADKEAQPITSPWIQRGNVLKRKSVSLGGLGKEGRERPRIPAVSKLRTVLPAFRRERVPILFSSVDPDWF